MITAEQKLHHLNYYSKDNDEEKAQFIKIVQTTDYLAECLASEVFKKYYKDKDFILQSITQINDECQHGVETILYAICSANKIYNGNFEIDDIDILRKAMQKDSQNPSILYYASPRLKNDEDFVTEAVQFGGSKVLQFASPEIQKNQKIVSLTNLLQI